MELIVQIKINEQLYLKDPQTSELGKSILVSGIALMSELGFEEFTFKKLAARLHSTEASIYRYFENKHRFLLYIISLYWHLLDFQLVFYTQNLLDPAEKLRRIVRLLSDGLEEKIIYEGINVKALYGIVVLESNKVYMTREVGADNAKRFFKPFNDLCETIATAILEYDPTYSFAKTLSSTLIEISHLERFFVEHLPELTDIKTESKNDFLNFYLTDIIFKTLKR